MEEANRILYYYGPIDNDVLTAQRAKGLPNTDISVKLERKLFMVLVELGQNIAKYSLDRTNGAGIGELSVFHYEDEVVFEAKNLASKDAAMHVINRCKQLNGLSREMLRSLRREIMAMPFNKSHIGAKLGLIQVCIYAEGDLNAQFETTQETDKVQLSISTKIKI